MKNNLTAISIICLAISIVIGSKLVSDGLNSIGMNIWQSQPSQIHVTTPTDNEFQYSPLMTKEDLAYYLGLNEFEIEKLGPVTIGSSTTSTIPYIKIGNTTYFSKEAIDNWLKNNEAAVAP